MIYVFNLLHLFIRQTIFRGQKNKNTNEFPKWCLHFRPTNTHKVKSNETNTNLHLSRRKKGKINSSNNNYFCRNIYRNVIPKFVNKIIKWIEEEKMYLARKCTLVISLTFSVDLLQERLMWRFRFQFPVVQSIFLN